MTKRFPNFAAFITDCIAKVDVSIDFFIVKYNIFKVSQIVNFYF